MLHSARRFFLVLFFSLASLILLNTLTTKSHAQEHSTVDQNVPINSHTRSQIQIIEFSSAVICQLVGIDPINPSVPCLGIDPISKNISYVQTNTESSTGLIGFSSNMIGGLYNKPFSIEQEVRHLAGNFGINKTYAQDLGQGFQSFSAVQALYLNVRNIVYMLLVILFVITGLAIMLRIKIDPRTVMTIQNQIPKITIGIVLITFSYAIAGLLVDVMWTVTYFGINTLTSSASCRGDTITQGFEANADSSIKAVATRGLLDNPVAFMTNILGDETGCFGSFDGVSGLAYDVSRTFGDLLQRITLSTLGLNPDFDGEQCNPGWKGWSKFWGFLDLRDCSRVIGFGFIKYFVSIIGALILFAALIISLFKIWFKLLKAYVSITIAVVLSPFWIILGLLPGGGLGFTQWMRHMIAHLALFPATVLMLMFARVVYFDTASGDPTKNVFLPPLIGNPNIADGMNAIFAFAVIMLTPDLMNMIRDALKTPQGKYTGNIINRAKANPMSAAGTASNFGYQMAMMRHIPWVGPKIPFIKDAPDVMHTRMEPTAKAQGAGPAH